MEDQNPEGTAPASDKEDLSSVLHPEHQCRRPACSPCANQTEVQDLREALNHTRVEVRELAEEVSSLRNERLFATLMELSMWLSLGLSLAFVGRELAKHRKELLYLGGVVSGLGARR